MDILQERLLCVKVLRDLSFVDQSTYENFKKAVDEAKTNKYDNKSVDRLVMSMGERIKESITPAELPALQEKVRHLQAMNTSEGFDQAKEAELLYLHEQVGRLKREKDEADLAYAIKYNDQERVKQILTAQLEQKQQELDALIAQKRHDDAVAVAEIARLTADVAHIDNLKQAADAEIQRLNGELAAAQAEKGIDDQKIIELRTELKKAMEDSELLKQREERTKEQLNHTYKIMNDREAEFLVLYNDMKFRMEQLIQNAPPRVSAVLDAGILKIPSYIPLKISVSPSSSVGSSMAAPGGIPPPPPMAAAPGGIPPPPPMGVGAADIARAQAAMAAKISAAPASAKWKDPDYMAQLPDPLSEIFDPTSGDTVGKILLNLFKTNAPQSSIDSKKEFYINTNRIKWDVDALDKKWDQAVAKLKADNGLGSVPGPDEKELEEFKKVAMLADGLEKNKQQDKLREIFIENRPKFDKAKVEEKFNAILNSSSKKQVLVGTGAPVNALTADAANKEELKIRLAKLRAEQEAKPKADGGNTIIGGGVSDNYVFLIVAILILVFILLFFSSKPKYSHPSICVKPIPLIV